MATSAFTKVNNFALLVGTGALNMAAAGATIVAMLSNTTPNATWTTVSQITELATSGGYTAGGVDIQNDYTASAGTGTMTAVDVTWTGSGSGFTARYAWLAFSTNILGWYDYGASQFVGLGETFVLDFGASVWTLA
jgi:hypothetical protein